jgi:hypothetical protein
MASFSTAVPRDWRKVLRSIHKHLAEGEQAARMD